jgi:hypothetical protein
MQDNRASSRVSRNLDHLLGPPLCTIFCMHSMTVSLAQGGEGHGRHVWRGEGPGSTWSVRLRSIEVHRLARDV